MYWIPKHCISNSRVKGLFCFFLFSILQAFFIDAHLQWALHLGRVWRTDVVEEVLFVRRGKMDGTGSAVCCCVRETL